MTLPSSDESVVAVPGRLTKPQRVVLAAVARLCENDDIPSEGCVGDAIGWQHQAFIVCGNLARKGLISRIDWEDEEWGYLVAITDAGRAMLDA